MNGGVVGALAGGNVVALSTGDLTVTTATTLTPAGGVAGAVRLGSKTGAVNLTSGTSSGDLVLTGQSVASGPLTVARDATVTALTGLVTLPVLTAGRDVSVTAGAATLGAGAGGLIAAQRNFSAFAIGPLMMGTVRAGGTLTANGGSVLATYLGAGDALTVTARAGDATVTTAASTGRPLLADFSDFAASGSAPGATRDIGITASGAVTLVTGTAVHSITVIGGTANVTTATANTGGSDGDLTITTMAGDATLGTGTGRDIRVATTVAGTASATTATAARDLYLDAPGGTAALTAGVAGRDGVVCGAKVDIGTLTAGDDIVAVAIGTNQSLNAGTLTSTGINSGDGIARSPAPTVLPSPTRSQAARSATSRVATSWRWRAAI